MRCFFSVFFIAISIFAHTTKLLAKKNVSPEAKATYENEKLYSIIQDACPISMVERYYLSLNTVIRDIPKVIDWEVPLKASIYGGCFLEMPPWRLNMAFSLAHGAIRKKYKKETVEKIILSVGSSTIRIHSFLYLAMLWENLIDLKLEEYIVEEIFHTCLGRKYSENALESAIFVYLQFSHKGLPHRDALAKILEHEEKLKPIRDRHSSIKKVSKIIKESQPQSLNLDGSIFSSGDEKEKKLETKTAWLLIRKNFSVRSEKLIHDEFEAWNIKRLENFVQKWLSTPYQWGGFSKSGIDCSGFVVKVILDQFPKAKLPRSAEKLSELGSLVVFRDLKYGDLVFFSASDQTDKITHVGIYIGADKFAHSSTKRGVTISVLSSKYYKKLFLIARRLN